MLVALLACMLVVGSSGSQVDGAGGDAQPFGVVEAIETDASDESGARYSSTLTWVRGECKVEGDCASGGAAGDDCKIFYMDRGTVTFEKLERGTTQSICSLDPGFRYMYSGCCRFDGQVDSQCKPGGSGEVTEYSSFLWKGFNEVPWKFCFTKAVTTTYTPYKESSDGNAGVVLTLVMVVFLFMVVFVVIVHSQAEGQQQEPAGVITMGPRPGSLAAAPPGGAPDGVISMGPRPGAPPSLPAPIAPPSMQLSEQALQQQSRQSRMVPPAAHAPSAPPLEAAAHTNDVSKQVVCECGRAFTFSGEADTQFCKVCGRPRPGVDASRWVAECSVCMSANADTAIVPCMHRCVCSSCALTIQFGPMQGGCPICRGPIAGTTRVYD